MQRRQFMATAAAPLGHAVLTRHRRPDHRPANCGRPARRQRGILMRVDLIQCILWEPTSWRDVPPRFDVLSVDDSGRSLAECRKLAKAFNQYQMTCGWCEWMVVVATDGRLASVKGGAV